MAVPETARGEDRPEGITCAQYVRGEGKRCRHYLPNGACSLPTEFMCVEWLKRNGHLPPPAARDLFGNPLPNPSLATPATPQPRVVENPAARTEQSPVVEQPPLSRRGLTTEEIESFKALGVEVCIRSQEYGELWLVSAPTGQPRKELTPEHLATIARVFDVFPGSRVVAFDKQPSAEPANDGSPA